MKDKNMKIYREYMRRKKSSINKFDTLIKMGKQDINVEILKR